MRHPLRHAGDAAGDAAHVTRGALTVANGRLSALHTITPPYQVSSRRSPPPGTLCRGSTQHPATFGVACPTLTNRDHTQFAGMLRPTAARSFAAHATTSPPKLSLLALFGAPPAALLLSTAGLVPFVCLTPPIATMLPLPVSGAAHPL